MAETPLFALLGPAGTGKTYKIQQKLLKNPKWGKLCATTGIAALNLGSAGGEGVITLQSTLGYFDTASLRENYQHGKLRRVLVSLATSYKFLVVDECSMLDAETLDILIDCLDVVNANVSEDHGEHPFGLILVGDFLQLPPVGNKGEARPEYCFEAKNWNRVIVEKLSEIKRQTDPRFLEILAAARCGDGDTAAKLLSEVGCFAPVPSQLSTITTIYATNKSVDERNDALFRKLCATGATRGNISASRWGKQRAEWKNIPEVLALAIGAYVMVLSNDTKDWQYANGDCGTVVGFKPGQDGTVAGVKVQLKRTNVIVDISRIIRRCYQKENPPGFDVPEYPNQTDWKKSQEDLGVEADNWKELYESFLVSLTQRMRSARLKPTEPYYDFLEEKWVLGELLYCPMRLAYATTTHKCMLGSTKVLTETGLVTLTNLQIGEKVWNGSEFVSVIGKAETYKMAYKIQTHHGFSAICGEDHPFIVASSNNQLIPSSQLVPDVDDLHIPAAPVWEYDQESSITPRLAWLLGAMVGDASYNCEKDGSIFFSSCDKYLNQKVMEIAATELACNPRMRKDGRGVYWSSVPVRKKLLELGLEHALARQKEIPKCIFTAPLEVMASFVKGLFDTDGSVGRSYVVYATSSRKVAKGLHLLLWRLGIYANKGEYQGGKYGSYFQLRIGAHSLPQFKKLIGFSRPERKAKLEKTAPNRIIRKWNNVDKVVQVTSLDRVLPMIDIEVEGENVFVANGILTHNSQGLTLDTVQIVLDNKFFGSLNMLYVALSRCRTLEGMKVIGTPGDVRKYCNTSKKLERWF